MAQSTFLQLSQKILNETNQPLSPEEIWAYAQSHGYDQEIGTKGKTPWRTIGAQIYVDIRDNPKSFFAKGGSRPTRFKLKSWGDTQVDDAVVLPLGSVAKKEYHEKDLHAFLVYFGFHYLKAYLRTINHSKSGKKEFGEWVHPDIVGCSFPFPDWKDEVVEFSSLMGNLPVKLYSFELKKELNFSNLRESFFQAVSNSSWAHEGYLAAATISADEEFETELERLSSSFGIGVIKIDAEDPDSTEIKIPARTKGFVDWETVNKIAMNPQFKDFLKRLKLDVANREARQEKYDPVLKKEELIKTIAMSKL